MGALAVVVLAERRYLAQEQPLAAVVALRRLGHTVRVVVPDEGVLELGGAGQLATADLVVARGRSDALLCWLAVAEQAGVPTVNTAEAVRRVVHKEVTGAALATAGLPVPRSWLLPASRLDELPEDAFPLVVKPPTGDNGRGVRLVDRPGETTSLPEPHEVVLAQTWVPFDGDDVKLYVIGDAVFAVRKASPLCATPRRGPVAGPPPPVRVAPGPPRPWPLTRELTEIARQCAALTGLDLLGIDLVLGPDGPVVVEVNDYPNFSSVPDAGELIAHHLVSRVRGAVRCASAS